MIHQPFQLPRIFTVLPKFYIMPNKTSPHILGTCTNLMGFCLLLITSLHISARHNSTHIDEFTAIVALFLTFSSILSFASIRTGNERMEMRLETLAELLFGLAMAGIVALLVFILSSF